MNKNKATCIFIVCEIIIILLLIIGICVRYTKERNDEAEETEMELIHAQRLVSAYEKLIHRIWLDKPSYVEDCLNETDEFIEVNDLYDNDWGSFEFWSEEDSIHYLNQLHQEWEEADILLRHLSQ